MVNIINGTSGNDVLGGTTDADRIFGFGGDDLILYGLGNDRMDGGTGIDTISYENAPNRIEINLTTSQAISTIWPRFYETILNFENVIGTNFDDKIYGNSKKNILMGGGGNDFFYADAGNDSIDGQDGVYDTLIYRDLTTNPIYVDLVAGVSRNADFGTDTVINIEGVDGASGNDVFFGDGHDNFFSGMKGDDFFDGGSWGNDSFNGFEGVDTVSFAKSEGHILVFFESSGNAFRYANDGSGETNRISFIDCEILIGTGFADTIFGGGPTPNFEKRIYAGGGDDILMPGNAIVHIYGEDGNDTFGVGGISAHIQFNTYDGGNGTDTLRYLSTDEVKYDTNRTIRIGVLNDIEFIDANGTPDVRILASDSKNILDFSYTQLIGISHVDAAGGDDVVVGSAASDVILGGSGNDEVSGGRGGDALNGGIGNDKAVFSGLSGDYTIRFVSPNVVLVADKNISNGDEGADTITDFEYLKFSNGTVTLADLTFEGTSGNDAIRAFTNDNWTLHGMEGIDDVRGREGADTLYGDGGNDKIFGFGGDDTIFGGLGIDRIDGGTGNDTINGGVGADILRGGRNADAFVFDTTSDARDTISDFSVLEGDVLELSGLLENYDAVTSAIADFVRITDNGVFSTVSIDKNGADGGASWVQIARLNGVTGLTDEAALLASGNLQIT